MRRLALATAVVWLTTGCVGIIDNEGMGEDGGSNGTSTGSIATTTSGATSGTTGSATSGTGASSTGPTSATTSTTATSTTATGTAGSTTATSGSTTGVGVSTSGTTGAGGASGTGGSNGSGGSGGSAPVDAGRGGAGGSGGRTDGGTAGGGNDASVGVPTFAQVSAIVQRNCASCHRTFTTYATLTTHAVGQCGGDMLAKPNDAANSAFLELVLGQCGTLLMPRACRTAPCIPAADINTFTAWINAGAPNN